MNKVTRTTTIQTISAKLGQRLLVVSDVHGSLDRLIQLLRKVKYTGDDILVIVGDLIDKGPESLRVVQYVMELCSRYPVYVSMGNVDMGRLLVLEEEAEKFSGYIHWLDGAWGGGLFIDMLADMGVSVSHLNEQNAAEYKERMCVQFEKELDFLRSRPTILTAGDYLFVHGGVPTDDLSLLEGMDAAQYLKNDNFLNQGYRFEKYHVVTGHWPVCLYREDEENNSPLFDYERGILCIDGGCGLKRAGQLNGILLPDCHAKLEEIQWTSYDDFPLAIAQERQSAVPATVHIRYFDSRVELLEENGVMARVRQISTGKEFEVPRKWVNDWKQNGDLHCDDYCDSRLAVEPGDELSIIFETKNGYYVKRNGRIGLYEGEIEPVPVKLLLEEGSPADVAWRRQRELETYRLLDELGIPFQRIDHCETNTMEACAAVDEMLTDAVICKNLFLCNQQRTQFYLLMLPGGKKFKTKLLSKQIGSARLSFAEAVYMERFLHITPGSVSVMGLMNDKEGKVQLLIDREILGGEWFGCHPCMNTSSMRMKLSDLLERFLPATGHEPVYVDLTEE